MDLTNKTDVAEKASEAFDWNFQLVCIWEQQETQSVTNSAKQQGLQKHT